MKLLKLIIAVVALVLHIDANEEYKQPRITCNISENKPINNYLCNIHCIYDGYLFGECNNDKQCVCTGDTEPICLANIKTDKLTCEFGGIISPALCSLHCIMHGCEDGECEETGDDKICQCSPK